MVIALDYCTVAYHELYTTYIYVYTDTQIHIYTYSHIQMHIYTYIHIHMHIFIYAQAQTGKGNK